MFLQLKKVNIISEGHRRSSVSFEKVYVNPSHIISVRDYEGIKQFLLNEGITNLEGSKYSLLRIVAAHSTEEMIVLGDSEEIYARLQKTTGKDLLNG